MTFIFRISRQRIRAHSVTLYVLIVSSCTDRYLIGSGQETVAIIFFNLGELNSTLMDIFYFALGKRVPAN